MKKLAPLLLFVLSLYSLIAQDYAPFQLNQTSLFRTEISDSGNAFVRSIRLDTVIEYQNRRVGYFNINREIPFDCYLKTIDSIRNPYQTFDSIVWLKDSIFVHASKGKFGIKRNLKIGDVWYSNGYKLEYSGTEQRSFLGVTDSVRIIKGLWSGYDILLSKNYGLLNYYVFHKFPTKPMTLAGIESRSIKAGLQKPKIKDVFNLKISDIVFRKETTYERVGMDWFRVYRYKKDSLINILETDSSVIYKYERTTYQWKKETKKETIEFEYNFEFFKRVFASNSGGFVLGDFGFFVFTPRSRINITDFDTTFFVTTQNSGNHLRFDCVLVEISDAGFHNVYNTRHSQYFWEMFSVGSPGSSEVVIGSIINGKSTGETKLPTGQDDIIESIKLDIYPNPVQNTLFLKQAFNTNTQVEVYSTDGKLLIEDNLSSNENSIDVSQLSNGTYVLKMVNDEGAWQKRVIIE